MKKNILIFGLIAGIILTALVCSINFTGDRAGHYGMVIGFSVMIIAFSFIYVAIRNFRDKYNQGVVSFGQGFLIGLGIALIGSTFYVVTWMIDVHFFLPDFMEKYSDIAIQHARNSGLPPAELEKKIASINNVRVSYRNPIFRAAITYVEVLPMGILVSLIAALIAKRRRARTPATVAVA